MRNTFDLAQGGTMRHARAVVVAVAVLVATSSVACTAAKAPTQIHETTSSTGDGPTLTGVVGDIVGGRVGEGENVTVVGYCRGWDLLGEVDGPPPVTRSDWVIRDDGGAVYVQANGVQVTGKLPDDAGRLPSQPTTTTYVLEVTGMVRTSSEGRPYIEPSAIAFVR